MSLFNIKEKLYKKDDSEPIARHDADQYDPKIAVEREKGEDQLASDLWKEKQRGLSPTGRKFLRRTLFISGAVIFLTVAVFIFSQIKNFLFSQGGASVSISGPSQIQSGERVSYEINYQNNNKISLENSLIRISFPDNFKPEESEGFRAESVTSGVFDLGEIKKKSQGRATLSGKAYTPKGSLIYLKAELDYKPSNFSSRFTTRSQMGVNVMPTPIILEIQAPQSVSSGDAVNYLISYKNDGNEAIANVRLKIDYPEGFGYSSSNPPASEGKNIWYLGNLESQKSGKITVSGKLEGERDMVKQVNASVGTFEGGKFISFNDESADTKIASSPLAIYQTVNGLEGLNIDAGDVLQFNIIYKNNGEVGLRDVIVTEKILGSVLDYSSLDLPGGAFDFENRTITWKASDFPSLKNLGPREGGTISFNIRVKEIIDVKSENDKNFVVSSLAKIDSPDVPTPISMNKIISSNQIDLKLNSKILLDVKGYYNDSQIPNSGPLPPKVGEETTYTIHWKITNVSNDLEGARVEAVIPTEAKMTGKIYPSDARISYNERTNMVIWDIGKMNSGVGIFRAPLEAAFQVMIKPSPDKTGESVDLLGKPKFTAKDLFTGEALEKTGDEKDTNLFEDGAIGDKSRVVN